MDKTVAKALGLLETIALSDRPRGVTELSLELGMTKANVHRLVKTLQQLGYLQQQEQGSQYLATLKLWELGSAITRRLAPADIARPVLRALCAKADESAQLAVLDGSTVVYVDKADSSHPLRATTQIGSRIPAHSVSCGKAILAFSDRHRARLEYPLAEYTPCTLKTKDEFEADMARAQADGFAVNRGEWREGIWGIAAPIHDANGEVVASIGVWGSEQRFEGEATARLGALVLDAATQVSAKLGYAV
ncbi:MAG: IclR family transcriptional regulator [Pusillimonas sp.]